MSIKFRFINGMNAYNFEIKFINAQLNSIVNAAPLIISVLACVQSLD